MDANLSSVTTVPAKSRTVTYRGSVEQFSGQQVELIGYSPVTNRYRLLLPNGDYLDNVRRQSFIG